MKRNYLFFGWSDIKSFFKNPVIQVSYAVVIGFPLVLEILKALNMPQQFPTTIFEIFYSGILLLLSFGIYAIFGPKEIKEYKNMQEYCDTRSRSLLVSHPDKHPNIVAAHLDPSQNSIREQIFDFIRRINEEIDPVRKLALKQELNVFVQPYVEGCVDKYLKKEWRTFDRKTMRVPLSMCFLLNAGGTVLALLVFIERIKVVIQTHLNQ